MKQILGCCELRQFKETYFGGAYAIPCENCLTTYIKGRKPAIHTRLKEDECAIPLDYINSSALAEHYFQTRFKVSLEKCLVVATESSLFSLKI